MPRPCDLLEYLTGRLSTSTSNAPCVVCLVIRDQFGGKHRHPQRGSRGRADRSLAGVCVHEGVPGHLPARSHLPGALGLSRSGYQDWLQRPPSARARRDAELRGRILAKWIESEKIYGCPRIHAALRDEGERVRSMCAEVPGGMGEPRPLSDDWWRILATPFSTAA